MTASILVTSPYQPFTLPNKFGAVFNGYVYRGEIDKDPLIPANQIQIYVVNEDGSRTAVPQPIRINSGGYAVYNGKPAKFVTDTAGSLLVQDSLGGQVWYEPNMAKVDPESSISYIFEQLANGSGSSSIGFIQAGVGATLRTVESKLRDFVNASDFGAVGDWVTDDTEALQNAINQASLSGVSLRLDAGKTYRVTPKTSVQWEGGTFLAALLMKPNLSIISNGAVIKISDNVSTDQNPVHHQMFFTNQVLHDVTFYGVTMDMNGQNNKISPQRSSGTFNRFMNAPICVSGTVGGAQNAASIDNCNIVNCKFKNIAGVSGIVCSQTNTAGARLGSGWNVIYNTFSNVGLDTDDHSSIYGRVKNLLVFGNVFENPSTINPATKTGGLCAVEIHASDSVAAFNTIVNYEQAFWVAANFNEVITSNIRITCNSARINSMFVDFWSKNLLPYGEPEGVIKQVSITGNTIEIIGAPSDFQVRSFFKCAARQQPNIVDFSNNVCRSFDTAGNTVLALIVVGPDQRLRADQLTISNNIASGIRCGLACYFGGDQTSAITKNVERVTFINNDLGYLSQSSTQALAQADVYLYGPNDGVIEQLYVKGLRSSVPIVTDERPSGRAKVTGSTKIPSKVSWDGVTSIGNGSITSVVSIDTDSGVAEVSSALTIGTTTTTSGLIFPRFTAVATETDGFASANHIKTGSALSVPCRVYPNSSWVSMFSPDGTAFNASNVVIGSHISVNAKIQCKYASI
ncbi:MAG: phage tailspike protein [Plesiomonas shigelloides]